MELTVAKTILQQLGGNKFIVMTGAKNLGGTENSLSGRIGRNPKSISMFKVTLDPDDTYFVEFFKVRKNECKQVSEIYDVYCEQLVEVFERETGLRLTL